MSADRYSPENIGSAGFDVDSKGHGQVSGSGGSVTVVQCNDPSHAGEGYVSVNSGDHHSTFVTDGQGGLIRKS